MNYEKSKAEALQLKMDTIALRLAIRKLQGSNDQYESAVANYENVLLPLKDSLNLNLQKQIEAEQKNGKVKYFKGARDGGVVMGILTILGYFVLK